jgi:hypothetical protein
MSVLNTIGGISVNDCTLWHTKIESFMKLLFSFLLLLRISNLHAQDSLEVQEVKKTISAGMQNGYSVTIPQARLKDVISDWKKYLHQKNKSSLKELDGEYLLSKGVLPDLSPDSVIVYSTVKASTPATVELNVFVSGKDSVFYSGTINPAMSTAIATYIRNFAVNEYREAVADEISLEQKKLRVLEDDLKDLEQSNDQYKKKIESNERSNGRIKEEIKSNLDLQNLKAETILQQQKILATYITPSDQKSEEEKKLKLLQKEK